MPEQTSLSINSPLPCRLTTGLALFLVAAVPALAQNTVPEPKDDLLLTPAGTALSFDYLLLNDLDADDDALTVSGTTTPGVGSLVDHGGGSFTYTPGGTGDDSFTYTAFDGQAGASATVRVSVNATFDAEAARDDILGGVTSLANPTGPGHLVVWGPTAHVISNYPGQDERDPMVAAATMGSGRVIAMPDHQWLNMDSHGGDTSTGNFYRNGIAWLAGTSSKSIKIVTLNSSCSTWLGNDGFSNVVATNTSNLATDLVGADVLITWPGSGASSAVIDEIRSFTKGGGGLFICDYGIGYDWWWGKEAPDIPGNRILRDAGIAFVKRYPHSGAQTINRASFHVTADHIIDVIANPTSYTSTEKDRAAEIFDRLNGVLADHDATHDEDTLQARLNEVFETKISSLIPTPTTPVSDSLEKALLNQEGLLLRDLPVTEMTAHRAALPVSPGAPRINTSITLPPPAVGHSSRLIDTGLYAAPGEIIDITVPAALNGIGLQVRIGHLRTDTGDSNYYTMPYQQLTFDLNSTSLQVASPHGGLLMFNAPSGTEWTGNQLVQVNGAVEAPYFVLGQTSNTDWVSGIRDRGTPFGVLVCDTTVLVVESEQWLRSLPDPHEVMDVYNTLIAEIGEFYDYDRGRELRIHHDYQAAGGVSAFPLSYGTGKDITNSRNLITSGEPLTMHEHGHHADSGQFIFHEFGETSPNLGGKYAQQTYSNFSWKQELGVGRVNNYLFSQSDDLWNHYNHYRVDVKVTPFDSIANTFGWESLKNVVHTISGLPSGDVDTSGKKLDQWLIQLGAETGHDVSPFLELWQLSFSATAKAAVDALPEWNMVEIVGEDLVLAQGTSITFGDPSVNDFSYDGGLVFNGLGSPASGGLVDHGNGTWTYTPAGGFTGKDSIDYTVTNATGNTFTGTISITVTSPANLPALDRGKAYANTDSWTPVTLDHSFTSPVVIAQVVHTDGQAPLVTRIRSAAGNSFELMLQRVDGLAGTLTGIQVQYLVVEEGVYNVADHGIKMEAVTMNSTLTDRAGNFTGQAVTLNHELWDHYFIPAIFGQVMTHNDPDWSAFWAEGGPTGYTVGKHVGEDTDTTRANETLGYVIMESGSLQIGSVRFQSGALNYDSYNGFNKVTSGGAGHSFVRMPAIAGALVQANGLEGTEDGYWTALQAPVGSGNHVAARLVEDQIGDTEQSHGDLAASYLLFSELGVTAIDDSVAAIQNAPALVAPLPNDLSSLGGTLGIVAFTQAAHGTVTDNGDGTLTYLPDPGYTGPDSFLCTVGDGTNSDTSLVSVTVSPVTTSVAGIMMDTWNGISGNSTSTMTGLASYPDSPDASALRASFDAPTNRGGSFGTRMHGLLIPPTTGDYTFWIASDDDSQLFLATDQFEGTKSQIASVSGWTDPQQWDKFGSQQSATISLQAGQAYFIEALHKEGGGGDNLAVAWQGPGIAQSVIGSPYLQTVARSAPTVANPLSDVVVIENAPDTTIDLGSLFADADPSDSVSISVQGNTTPSLLGTSLAGSQLTLSHALDQSGTTDITIRGVDESGAMVTDTFTVTVLADNDGDGDPDASDPDDDNDGIPDSWETAHGLDPFTDDTPGDPDGDGQNNWAEYLADTDPQDHSSYPYINVDPDIASGDPTVRFQTSANRRYLVQYHDHLDGTPWQDLGAAFDGSGGEMTVTDTTVNLPDQRFYRLRVTLQP